MVLWGIKATGSPADDPAVFQGVNGEPIEWYPEHRRTSTFLLVMLHWQGAFGGAMRWSGTCLVHPGLAKSLDKGWRFVGEVNKMRAYSRPRRAVCLLEWEDGWRVFCGATTERAFERLDGELGVVLD